jgi:site-specific recombinase XerD
MLMLVQIEEFVNWVRRRNPEARTWKDYGYDLRFFLEAVGNRPPNTITFRDVDRFVTMQSERGFKATTINRRLAAVMALYMFLSEEDNDLVCPVLPRRHHLREPQRLPRPVQEGDLKQFFAVISSTRDRAMFLLMLRCGLRIGEVANLRLADLYLDEDHPRLVVRGKSSRERSVYLSPQAEHALRFWLAERPSVSSECVFLSYQHKGLSTTSIHNCLLKYRERAGIHLTAHRLRHSFASDLVNADAAVTSIQKLMGHRWLETTQIYIQANDKQVREDYYAACQKLEGWQSPRGML